MYCLFRKCEIWQCKRAVLDGLGIIADTAALMLPCVPGGVGALIKGSRVADKLDGAKDTAKAIKNARKVQ